MLADFLGTPAPVEFLIMALATWRLSVLLVFEGGPANIFGRIRQLFGIDHDADTGAPLPYIGGGLGGLFSCVWCMAFWQAIIVLWTWVYAPYVVTGAAIWGAASIIESLLERLNR